MILAISFSNYKVVVIVIFPWEHYNFFIGYILFVRQARILKKERLGIVARINQKKLDNSSIHHFENWSTFCYIRVTIVLLSAVLINFGQGLTEELALRRERKIHQRWASCKVHRTLVMKESKAT